MAKLSYRPDVDGLRAVAILTVVAFHALPSAMPGGFIGVDIFFVISGYLISGIILGELKLQRFSIKAFYGRRIRRIFPALVLVLVTTLIIGRFVLFPGEFRELGRHTLAGAAFVANIALWRDADYFDVEAARKPLLHLWSLGIEEQFYIAWPFVLWLTRNHIRRAFWIVSAVIVVSFSLNIIGIYVLHRDTLVFYAPLTRVWELACGSLLALIGITRTATPGGDQSSAWMRNAASIAGLILVVAGLFTIDRYVPFPGRAALLPIIGAVLLIAAGPTTWINRVILSHPVAVFIGLISFPLYLWHWPLLAFQSMLWPGSWLARSLALLLAAMLATLTYWYLERPIRASRTSRSRNTLILVVANGCMAIIGALAYADYLTRPVPPDAARMLAAASDWEFPTTTALDRSGRLDVREIGTDKPQDITLYIGDSHVQQYWPRLMYLSEKWRPSMNSVDVVSYAGCPPLPGITRVDQVFRCPQFFDQAIKLAESPNVKVVVFAGWWEWYFLPQYPGGAVQAAVYRVGDSARRPVTIDSPEGQRVLDQFGALVRKLVHAHKRVYVLLSNPTSAMADPLSMVQRVTYRVSEQPTIDRSEFELRAKPVTSRLQLVAQQAGAVVVDPVQYLCDPIHCRATLPDGLPLFKDSNHLRALYARQQEYLDPFNF